MPSGKDYKRDYKREYEVETNARRQQRAQRDVIEREAAKAGISQKGDGLDLDHIKPLSKGGSNTLANVRSVEPGQNRSILRNPDGSLKSQLSHRERKKP
jgi:5-methylcytosine-specific restriction endonuclease McrA